MKISQFAVVVMSVIVHFSIYDSYISTCYTVFLNYCRPFSPSLGEARAWVYPKAPSSRYEYDEEDLKVLTYLCIMFA